MASQSGFVPAAGWAFFAGVGPGTDVYEVLGPFAAGTILRRMRITLNLLAGGVGVGLQFSPVMTSCPDASAAGHRAGTPLVQRSGATMNGQPGLLFTAGAADQFVGAEIYPGVPFRVGASYVVVGLSVTSAQGAVYCNVGVEVARLVPGGP